MPAANVDENPRQRIGRYRERERLGITMESKRANLAHREGQILNRQPVKQNVEKCSSMHMCVDVLSLLCCAVLGHDAHVKVKTIQTSVE